MKITDFIQHNQKNFLKMLEEMKLRLQNESNEVKKQLKKILETLVPMLLTDFPNYQKQVDEQTLPFRQRHKLLLERLDLVESMIQKLSQPELELTDNEGEFLSRLFLASKLGSPESMRLEINEYLKNLKLMSDIIYLTLSRYKGITTMWNSECSWYVVRAHLCQTGKGRDFYQMDFFGSLTWDVKREKDTDYDTLAKKLADSALEYCVFQRNIFKQCFSDFNFEKLMSDFEGCVSAFSEQFPIQIIDYVFSQEESESSNRLLESLLTLESTFLDEKKKFQTFYKQFQAFLKEISGKLTPILYQQREYETRNFGDCPRSNSSYRYEELCSDLKYLIMKMTDVLENKCQNTCECNHLKPDLYPGIVHTPVVMTPVETAEVDKLVREFFARFP
jgi:hypothetical protein